MAVYSLRVYPCHQDGACALMINDSVFVARYYVV